MKVAFITLGCKVNHYESQAMEELFLQDGWEVTDLSGHPDAVVINTCTVTATGDAKSRQMIAKAHRLSPDALIAVTGCYAQLSGERVRQLPGVRLVIGTGGKTDIVRKVKEAFEYGEPVVSVSDIRTEKGFEPMSAVRDSRTRATLKIQDGCENFCSYCAIPYARGPIRSRPVPEVEKELKQIAESGYPEVVLTGIHLASYGKDLGTGETLLDIIHLCEQTDGLKRIRLGSIEPGFADERFAETAVRSGKLCRQFHLSLQSGSDPVLKRMNRKYSAGEFAHSVRILRDAMPDCAVTTDVIAGFCRETEEEHQETLAFCREMAFARMHVFPFSLRKGTAAEKIGGIPERSVRERRAGELILLGKELSQAFLKSQIGSVQNVLSETGGFGYTGNYIRTRVDAPEGSILTMQLTGIDGEIAEGRILN